MKPFVGIVILNYNRWDVTALCLDSLYRVSTDERSKVGFRVYLVENSSDQVEREKSARFCEAFALLQSNSGMELLYMPQENNLGYPAGNNVGIRAALEDSRTTHVCLLNNDTIVSPQWLDDLVQYAGDSALVSPISNSVGNEQIVPVTYLNREINGYTRHHVFEFAEKWRSKHIGNVVSAQMLCFFCVLGSRKLFEEVGLLDEAFGLGNFEDDDFSIRCLKQGYGLNIVRQVFIHHWGSFSMGSLAAPRRAELFKRNQKILEKKHGIKWAGYDGAYLKAAYQELEWIASQRALGLADAQDECEVLKSFWALLGLTRPAPLNHQACISLHQPARVISTHATLVAVDRIMFTPVRWVFLLLTPMLVAILLSPRRGFNHACVLYARAKARIKKQITNMSPKKQKFKHLPRAGHLLDAKKRQRILILPIDHYFGRRQRHQHIAEALADLGFDVDWLDPVVSAYAKDMPEIVNIIPRKNGFLRILRINKVNFRDYWVSGMSQSEALDVANQLGELKVQYSAVVCQFSFWAELMNRFDAPTVFDCMDNHSDFLSATIESRFMENCVLKNANKIVVTSPYLERAKEKKGLRADRLVRNGCHPSDFPLHPLPDNLTPVVGYFGAVGEWFDYKLMLNLAEQCPHMDFEVIGDFGVCKIKDAVLPSNFRLLGEKPYYELATLTQNWNCAVIPFLITPLIEATNPVKLYEYSALGLPVISTAIPEVLLAQAEVDVLVGTNANDWAQLIKSAVQSDTQEKRKLRRKFAELNTWAHRAESMVTLISNQQATQNVFNNLHNQ